MRLLAMMTRSRLSARFLSRAPTLVGLLLLSTASAQGPSRASSAEARKAPGEAESAAEAARRYPYDPVCGWGRLADGHGMLVRCLTRSEAQQFARRIESEATLAPGAAPAPPPAATVPPRAKAPTQVIMVSRVGPLKVDSGELPDALKQLSKPRDRYAQCVAQHGGLSARHGSVTVRFLVRETGRAEGVSVQQHQGMTLEAAKCIAEVVDRRSVGFPEAPVVGASLTLTLVAQE